MHMCGSVSAYPLEITYSVTPQISSVAVIEIRIIIPGFSWDSFPLSAALFICPFHELNGTPYPASGLSQNMQLEMKSVF